MDFQEATRAYQELKQKREEGKLPAEEFRRGVEKLRFRDRDKTWWTLNPVDGTWLKWNGTRWEPANPPAAGLGDVLAPPGAIGAPVQKQLPAQSPAATKTGKAQQKQQQPPQTLMQLFGMILRGMLKKLPRYLLLLIIAFPVIFVLHTWLMGWINDGFQTGGYPLLDWTLVLRGRLVSGTLFYVLLGALTAYFLSNLFRGRLGSMISGTGRLPETLRSCFNAAGSASTPLLLGSGGAGLILGALMNNPLVNLQLALLSFGALLAQNRSLLSNGLRLGWSDYQRKFKGAKEPKMLPLERTTILVCGLTAGFASAMLLTSARRMMFCAGAAGLVLVGLTIYLVLRQKGSKAGGMAALFGLTLLGLLTITRTVQADDGGFIEFGGSLIDWLSSPGGIETLLRSLAAGGGLLGGLMAGFSADDLNDLLEGMTLEDLQTLMDLYEGAQSLGDMVDNPFTSFGGGDGPGICPGMGVPNYWVNTASLNLVIRDTFFKYKNYGIPLVFTITYNSNPSPSRAFGKNWRFSFNWEVEEKGDYIYLWKGSGQRLAYHLPAGGAAGSQGQPKEALRAGGQRGRLWDYGTSWVYVELSSGLNYRFDKPAGQGGALLTSVSDRNANTLKVDRNPDGSIRSLTDPAGRVTSFTHDAAGLCTGMTFPDGRQAGFLYDSFGRLVQTTDCLGIVSNYEYDEESLVARLIVDKDHKTTRFAYQASGKSKIIHSVTNAGGQVTEYRLLGSEPRRVKEIRPDGSERVYGSSNGLTEQIVDAAGEAGTQQYQDGLPVQSTDRTGKTSTLEYDEQGNLLCATDSRGFKRSFEYDAQGYPVANSNGAGESWRYSYDGKHNMVKSVSPTGIETTYEYNLRGLLFSKSISGGGSITYTYDRFGNIKSITDALGNKNQLEWDIQGLHLSAITDPGGNTTRFEHDLNGRLTRLIHPDDSALTYEHNCCTATTTIDENGGQSSAIRDPLLKITGLVDPLGNKILYTLDALGRSTAMTDANNHHKQFAYNNIGQRVRETDALGNSIQFVWDAEDHLIGVVDENGHATGYGRDGEGNLESVTDPLGNVVRTEHDNAGRLSIFQNARGETVRYSRTQGGMVLEKQYASRPMVVYRYDPQGQLAGVDDEDGKTRIEHDSNGAVSAITYPGGDQVIYRRNPIREPERISYPGGLEVCYAYNNRNRISRVSWGEQEVRMAYDAKGNLVEIQRSNGTVTLQTWDASGRMASLEHRRGDETQVRQEYHRDAAGNITSMQGMQPTLPAVGSEPGTATFDEANQLILLCGEACRYDADGNLVEMRGGRWTAEYNDENNLERVTRNGQRSTFRYNGMNQRCLVETPQESRRDYFDRFNRLLYSTDMAGQVRSRYIYAGESLVARVDAGGGTAFYHFDPGGNTLLLTDPQGKVIASYAYDPFGLKTASAGADPGEIFTFVGEYGVMDDGDGLYQMRHRHYDAHSGRFIERDPAGFRGGLNFYAYGWNNPVNRIDPEGMDVMITPVVGGTVLVIGGIALALGVAIALYAAYHYTQEEGCFHNINEQLKAAEQRETGEATQEDVEKVIEENPGGMAAAEQVMEGPKVVVEETLKVVPGGGAAVPAANAFRKMIEGDNIGAALEAADAVCKSTPMGPVIPPVVNFAKKGWRVANWAWDYAFGK